MTVEIGFAEFKEHVAQGDKQAAFGLLGFDFAQLGFKRGDAGLRGLRGALLAGGFGTGGFGALLGAQGFSAGSFGFAGARLQAQLAGLVAGVLQLAVGVAGLQF